MTGNKMARAVTVPRECLKKTYLKNKMLRCGYVLEDGRRIAKLKDL